MLGHQHKPQKLAKDTWHVGSLFYKSFNEVNNTHKYITVVDKEKIDFLPITAVIPMTDVTKLSELEHIDPRTKVRIILKSFDQYKKEISSIKKYENKFHEFKIKLDFVKTPSIKTQKHEEQVKLNFKEITEKWLNQIPDQTVKEILRKEFVENGIVQ